MAEKRWYRVLWLNGDNTAYYALATTAGQAKAALINQVGDVVPMKYTDLRAYRAIPEEVAMMLELAGVGKH